MAAQRIRSSFNEKATLDLVLRFLARLPHPARQTRRVVLGHDAKLLYLL